MTVILDDGGLHNALGHIVRIRKIKHRQSLFVDNDMKTVAYLRVSTASQDLANQKLAILDHAHQKHFAVDRFVEVQTSSRKGRDQEGIDALMDSLRAGDRLVVSCRVPGGRRGRRPARAAVCRIPCLILCLADVERVCQYRAPNAPCGVHERMASVIASRNAGGHRSLPPAHVGGGVPARIGPSLGTSDWRHSQRVI